MRFRKKPVVIDAVQFDGSYESYHQFADARCRWFAPGPSGRPACLEIRTLEGVMTATPGDWIIKGVKGELYPCRPDIFEATYEPVSASPEEP
jgi:hypothetical protein